MNLSAEGREFIKQAEGFRGRTYRDTAGFATIGYGHRLLNPQSFPDGIDEPQATEILLSDVRDAEQAVQRLVKVALTQGQFDALVDFAFNLGAGRLASSTLLKVLNQGRFEAAGEQLLRWDLAGGEQNAGLKARREGEMRLWNGSELRQQAA